MLALLTQQECELALEGEEMLPAELTAAQKMVIMKKAYSAILLSLGDEVLGEVSGEKKTTTKKNSLEFFISQNSLMFLDGMKIYKP